MVQVDVKIDSTALFARMQKGERRLAYGVVNAINKTMKQAQIAAHQHVRGKVQVRKTQFLFGSPARPGGAAGRISPFASVGQQRAFAEIAIGASTLKGNRRLLLGILETGGTKQPSVGGASNVAVPVTGTAARPSFPQSVPTEMTFARLRFRKYRDGKVVRRRSGRAASLHGEFGKRLGAAQGEQWKGEQRTFIVPDRGVYQRVGPGRGDVRILYTFKPTVTVKRRLAWTQVVRSVIADRFDDNMNLELFNAVGRAGGLQG